MGAKFSFPVYLFFFFFFFLIHETTTAYNLIHETCHKCAENDPNLNYNFCVTSLQAVPISHCVKNLRQLGMISIKLTQKNVTNTKSYIEQLLRKNKKTDMFIRACLNDCFDLYSDAIPTVKKAMKYYKAKKYDDANIAMSSVIDACTTCEDGFKEKQGVISPLTKRNNDTFQLSAMALSIIDMLP